jgi:hypothetical protein
MEENEEENSAEDSKNSNIDDPAARAKRAVQYNERFNVPEQTEKEEAESHGNVEVENLAEDKEIERRKKHSGNS